MEVTTHSLEETKNLAFEIGNKIIPGDVIVLYGELGSGKTTFTSFLVKELGFESRVQSPTFVIIRKYSKKDKNISKDIKIINHIDLYRLSDVNEVKELDLEEVLSEPHSVTFIEWPELAESYLYDFNVIKIKIEIIDETVRRFYVQNLH